MSDTDRYARVCRILKDVLQQPPAQRLALLREACGDDDELQAEIESLLDFSDDGTAGEDLFSDGQIAARREAAEQMLDGVASGARAVEQIAGYRIVRRIATGGMGTVYEAEQEHPARTVAIKMIDRRDSSATLVSRFRREAQILGRLRHPGIAQIFDADTVDAGEGTQPYLVMEYVDGDPLTKHADRAGLDVRGRLRLLARVCDAVDYAHGQGVIHRDLKPDNVLVEVDEHGEGRPRVLDFGIARATDDSTWMATQVTQDGQLLGTLSYMAPEQLGGDLDAVTTLTDVYALGVIAFELLARQPTHDVAGLALGSAVRVLTEDEAPPLGTIDASLRGDVETIVSTALEKDPNRRYPSAAAFAADIRRFLDDHPIAARRPSRIYRARKFVQRHRVLVGGVTATIVTLIAASIYSAVIGAREYRQRLEAEQTTYRTSVLAAGRAAADHQPEAARQYLDEAPERLRGWEWYELSDRIDTAPDTVFDLGHASLIAIAPDGSYLSRSATELRKWDPVSGHPMLTIELPSGRNVEDSRFFQRDQGREIVGVSEDWIGVWDLETGDRVALHSMDDGVGSTRYTLAPAGQTVLRRDATRFARFDLETGTWLAAGPELEIPAPLTGMRLLATSPDLSMIALLADESVVVIDTSTFVVRRLDPPRSDPARWWLQSRRDPSSHDFSRRPRARLGPRSRSASLDQRPDRSPANIDVGPILPGRIVGGDHRWGSDGTPVGCGDRNASQRHLGAREDAARALVLARRTGAAHLRTGKPSALGHRRFTGRPHPVCASDVALGPRTLGGRRNTRDRGMGRLSRPTRMREVVGRRDGCSDRLVG